MKKATEIVALFNIRPQDVSGSAGFHPEGHKGLSVVFRLHLLRIFRIGLARNHL
jgi:hypothetical protein